jgi:hypothetical protein
LGRNTWRPPGVAPDAGTPSPSGSHSLAHDFAAVVRQALDQSGFGSGPFNCFSVFQYDFAVRFSFFSGFFLCFLYFAGFQDLKNV